jgi:alpha-D-ribose 1-methylphosphonate 5-triphosphate synthase subunit PhnH
MVTQAVKDAIAIRNAQYYEYPQGIDFLFASGAGELFAIPRLVNTT